MSEDIQHVFCPLLHAFVSDNKCDGCRSSLSFIHCTCIDRYYIYLEDMKLYLNGLENKYSLMLEVDLIKQDEKSKKLRVRNKTLIICGTLLLFLSKDERRKLFEERYWEPSNKVYNTWIGYIRKFLNDNLNGSYSWLNTIIVYSKLLRSRTYITYDELLDIRSGRNIHE